LTLPKHPIARREQNSDSVVHAFPSSRHMTVSLDLISDGAELRDGVVEQGQPCSIGTGGAIRVSCEGGALVGMASDPLTDADGLGREVQPTLGSVLANVLTHAANDRGVMGGNSPITHVLTSPSLGHAESPTH